MRLLLNHDADLNALDDFGDSPLHKAILALLFPNIDHVELPVNSATDETTDIIHT